MEQSKVDMVEDELLRLRAEVNEQARLNGMGAERELRLMAERDALRDEVERLRAPPAPVAQHVRCIGRGDTGCGHLGGKSGDTCPSCGGMLLSCEAQIKALKAVAATPAPVALTPAQQHADALLEALYYAESSMSDYAADAPYGSCDAQALDMLRGLIANIEATGQEGGSNG